MGCQIHRESCSIVDRGHAVWFSAAGPNNVVLSLKWMLAIVEPETRTLWLGKAVPRDWLVPGEAPLRVINATTRYGRVSFALQALPTLTATNVSTKGGYIVRASVTLPKEMLAAPPEGGIALRIRAPLAHAGRLSSVTVGGKQWDSFNASTETINFAATDVSPKLLAGLENIIAVFASAVAEPLCRASLDLSKRIVFAATDRPPQSVSSAESLDQPPSAQPANIKCPPMMTQVDVFNINDTAWIACEDLVPGGTLALVPSSGTTEYFTKGYEPYGNSAMDDRSYYLGLGRAAVANSSGDILGQTLLCNNTCEPSWSAVERAVPQIRKSGNTKDGGFAAQTSCDGIRTFVASRDSSIDFTFNDLGRDCGWNGSPSAISYAQGLHNKAIGAPHQELNTSAVADGMVGDFLPSALFYFPVFRPSTLNCTAANEVAYCNVTDRNSMCTSTCSGKSTTACEKCKQCQTTLEKYCNLGDLGWTRAEQCSSCVKRLTMPAKPEAGHRHWTYMNIPKATMGGSREQGTWLRMQQVECAGPDMTPPCTLVDWPEYWDSMWFARYPSSNPAANLTIITGGAGNASSAAGFYGALLKLRQYWKCELAHEKMMSVLLPNSGGTNGSYLATQAIHSLVRSMITRQNTWHPRYGVTPGLGNENLHGLADVFTSTATAALELGAFAYARGVIDNYFTHYVRSDGMSYNQGVELPSSARSLTVLALYFWYSGVDDKEFLEYFDKARAVAELLQFKRSLSLNFSVSDPRFGIPCGDAEALDLNQRMIVGTQPRHYYASAAETYRAFNEMGRVWSEVGARTGRHDVVMHGASLLSLAPLLHRDLHASMNRTVQPTGNPSAPRRWPFEAHPPPDGSRTSAHAYRAYPAMAYSGALTHGQVDDIYNSMASGGVNRTLVLGIPSMHNTISTRAPFGLAYALLQHDMIERFLLHFFALSAHGYTRGTWTTPEVANIADRDEPAGAYASTGVATVPIYLKWMLLFEDHGTGTLWIGKAIPRGWLEPGADAIIVHDATSRYGRIHFMIEPFSGSAGLSIRVNISLPVACVKRPPFGGLRVRLRPPKVFGKLVAVTVGGKVWNSFSPTQETIDFAAAFLTLEMIQSGLTAISARFG